MNEESRYLYEQMRAHIRFFFTKEALALFDATPVLFLPFREAARLRTPAIAIPADIPAPVSPTGSYKVPFNGTQLTLWNRLPRPREEGWDSIPDRVAPLWHRHQSGTLIPAWNLFANSFDLLTSREETDSDTRDRHGRFTATMSPRTVAGLLEVPAVNEAVAAIVAACAGMKSTPSQYTVLDGLLLPPILLLSHDLDILLGNGMWTQIARLYQMVSPIRKGRPPKLDNLWWIVRNLFRPRDFYMDNITGMVDLEHMLGFRSALYFLNGHPGRYGRRSPNRAVREAVSLIPAGWTIGMHYNYDTLLDAGAFRAQQTELTSLVGRDLDCGRAHYLRFDAARSPQFLSSVGIRVDESAGYPDRTGYRCGIAGAFRPFNGASRGAVDVWEVPLAIMDEVFLRQYGDQAIVVFRRMIEHVRSIGGAVSLLFHTGQFYNPEYPHTNGAYRKLLEVARTAGAQGMSAKDFLSMHG